MALTNNNAGIVEAIKRQSGSTKFYKPSFAGIIQAIQDWGGNGGSGGGGGSAIIPGGGQLPDNPESGDIAVVPNGNGDYFMYVYSGTSWEDLHITTEEVETAGAAPFMVMADGTEIKTQKDINVYLDNKISSLESGEGPDLSTYATLQEMNEGDAANLVLIQANEANVAAAQGLAEKAENDAVHAEASAGAAHSQASSAASLANTANAKADAAQATADEALASAGQGGEAPDLSNYATKGDLSTATAGLPYKLETDKTMRSLDLPTKQIAGDDPVIVHAGGEIQLVDNLGFFHNVTFTGRHGIETQSTAAGIEISASDLKSRIEVLEEAVQTLASLIPPVDIGNVTITSSADINGNPGSGAAGQEEMFVMTANNDGETQHGLRYHWTITRGSARISGTTHAQSCTAWCNDPPPSTATFQCVISHPADADEVGQATYQVVVSE